jgi:hypothetical protein
MTMVSTSLMSLTSVQINAIVSTSLMSLQNVHINDNVEYIIYQSIISWTSAMYSRLPFICTLISDINDVLNIVIYVYTYWWYQWCTHHGNLFVHLLSLISVHIKDNVEYITDVTNKSTNKWQSWVHQWCH